MKLLLLCASALLPVGVATAEDPAATAKANKGTALDGTWAVLSAEKNGEVIKDARDMTVTGDVITCNCAKSGTTMRIELTGPGPGKVTTTEGKEKGGDRLIAKDGAKEAVIVLTTDYLAVCIHDERPSLGGDGKPRDRNTDAAYQASTKGQCTVVLKRGESTK